MFTIIGGDGREYGPATAEQIRTWITAGRANLDTKAKAVGSEEWRRLGDFAEFAPAAAASPPPMAAPEAPPPFAAAPLTTPPEAPAGSFAAPAPAAAVPALIPAERGPRFLARFIDWVLEFAVGVPGGAILGTEVMKLIPAVMQGHPPDFEDLDMKRLVLGGAVLVCGWLILLVIQVWMLSTRSQSIGKRIAGVRIVKLDGAKPGIVHAWLMRELLMTVFGFMLSLLPLIGPFLLRPALFLTDWCMIFRDDHRCLHDLLAGTKVVKA